MSASKGQGQGNLILNLSSQIPITYVVARVPSDVISWFSEMVKTPIGSSLVKDVHVWKPTRGMHRMAEYHLLASDPAKAGAVDGKTAPANDVMIKILESGPFSSTDKKATLDAISQKADVFLMINPDHSLNTDPLFTQRLCDFAEQKDRFQYNNKMIVIVSDTLVLPRKLERLVDVVYFDNPSKDGYTEALKETLSSYIDIGTTFDYDSLVPLVTGMSLYEVKMLLIRTLPQVLMSKNKDGGDLHKKLSTSLSKARVRVINKSPLLELVSTKQTFEDVGGFDRVKRYLKVRKGFWTPEAREYGLPKFRGIIITGIPGTGKSLVCKATAKEWGLPLIKFDPSKMFSGVVGSSEANIRQALATIESAAPCIAWIDELEKVMAGLGSSNSSDAGTVSRVISTFLTWMQETTADVVVMATANDVSSLPPEILRRFDDIFFVGLPSLEERVEIFATHLSHMKCDKSKLDLNYLAEKASRRTGYEIEKILSDALYEAYSDGRRPMTTEDVENVIQLKAPLVTTMAEQMDKLRSWVGEDPVTGEGVRARYASSYDTRRKKSMKVV